MSDGVQRNGQTDGHTYQRMELKTGTPVWRSWTLADKADRFASGIKTTSSHKMCGIIRGWIAKLGESAWNSDNGRVVYGEWFGRGR